MNVVYLVNGTEATVVADTSAAWAAASTAQLVQRAKRGERDAFAELIRQHERTALAVAYATTGDASTAGDAAQEAFLRAWQRLAALNEDGRFATWLCGIVRNVALDIRRRQQRDDRLPGRENDDDVADPVAELDRRERCERVDEALWQLDEVSRTMVVLRYYENLSSRAIAELLATTPTAVDMRLSRARHTLRTALERIRT